MGFAEFRSFSVSVKTTGDDHIVVLANSNELVRYVYLFTLMGLICCCTVFGSFCNNLEYLDDSLSSVACFLTTSSLSSFSF